MLTAWEFLKCLLIFFSHWPMFLMFIYLTVMNKYSLFSSMEIFFSLQKTTNFTILFSVILKESNAIGMVVILYYYHLLETCALTTLRRSSKS